MNDWSRDLNDRMTGIVTAVAGLFLVLSPWLFGFAAESGAAWNSWIAGALIGVTAVGTLLKSQEWEEWALLALGSWTLVSPWVLGFAGVTAAAAVSVAVGALVMAVSAYELWKSHNRPMSAA
jgi:hypothetical protein